MLTTQAAVRAGGGGYEEALKSYVHEASRVQSQYVVGRNDVGYVSGVLLPEQERDKEAEGRFFAKWRAHAGGAIKVSVPRAFMEGRRRDAATRGRPRQVPGIARETGK
jgi:hypothetical protein